MNVPIPPHQIGEGELSGAGEDRGGWFPSEEHASSYHSESNAAYHGNRLNALRVLSDFVNGESSRERLDILDYGIGDSLELQELGFTIGSLTGIDISPHMIDLARANLSAAAHEVHLYVGNVDRLAELPTQGFDVVMATNVLGYLSDEDERRFFGEAARLLRPGGWLLLMSGNELFDLFALNSGTARFFRERLGVDDVSRLLTQCDRPRWSNARRHNPLQLPAELERFGFVQRCDSFAQWHREPPVLLELEDGLSPIEARLAARDQLVLPALLSESDRWKALFQCSIFGAVFQLSGVAE